MPLLENACEIVYLQLSKPLQVTLKTRSMEEPLQNQKKETRLYFCLAIPSLAGKGVGCLHHTFHGMQWKVQKKTVYS